MSKARSSKTWFNIVRNASNSEEGTIDIFDEIGAYGISAKNFIRDLRALSGLKKIEMNIDSPGGDVNAGLAIFDAIKASKAKVTANITGMAASMASVIMLAADTIRITENGRVMLHRVTSGASGNADEIDAAAKATRQFEDRIIQLYLDRTGADEPTVRGWMNSITGTWFFGQEAVEAGFADEVITGTKARAFQQRWAGMFTMLPSCLFDITAITAPGTPATPPVIIPASPMKMTDAQKARLKELLRSTARTPEEDTELATLTALATKAGVDAAAEIAAEDAATAKAAAEAAARAAASTTITMTPEAFQAAITAGVTAATKPLEDRLKKIEDLRAAGVPGAPWSATAAQGARQSGEGDGDKKELTHAEWSKLPGPRAKAEFFRKGGKLIEPAA